MTFTITTQNHYFTDSERPQSQTYSYQEATKRYQKLNSGYQNEMKYQHAQEVQAGSKTWVSQLLLKITTLLILKDHCLKSTATYQASNSYLKATKSFQKRYLTLHVMLSYAYNH